MPTMTSAWGDLTADQKAAMPWGEFVARFPAVPVTLEVFGPVLEQLRQRAKTLEACVAVLEARIRTLEEEPHVKFCGPYDGTHTYGNGDVVVDAGSSWISLRAGNRTRPDERGPSPRPWALLAKRGRDAR